MSPISRKRIPTPFRHAYIQLQANANKQLLTLKFQIQTITEGKPTHHHCLRNYKATPSTTLQTLFHPSLLLLLGIGISPAGIEMDQTGGIPIKIYDVAAARDRPSASCPSSPLSATHGRKRQAMAKGMQKTLSKTSMLVNFLPTGTLLTFEMLLPAVSGDGTCSPVSTMMINALLGLCAISCFFFHFTDSFRGPDGKVYYGFVTPKGLAVFKSGLGLEVPKDERFKVGFVDLVHALMSVLVFAAIALSDHRVTNCLFPGHEKEMDEVMESFPLMVGIICSGLFLVFPNTRYGIGCMAS